MEDLPPQYTTCLEGGAAEVSAIVNTKDLLMQRLLLLKLRRLWSCVVSFDCGDDWGVATLRFAGRIYAKTFEGTGTIPRKTISQVEMSVNSMFGIYELFISDYTVVSFIIIV